LNHVRLAPTGIPVGAFLFRGRGILTMNRNVMMLVIGGLAVAVVVLGYQVYQDRQKKGVEISIGEKGISIEKK
jgi:uncharacterized membrane protein YebE (DUF533 family)